MENITNKNKRKFMNNIIVISLGLIIFATLISLSLNFSFGIILFGLGIFVDSIATLLGAFKQFMSGIRNPPLERTIESAMFFAGCIAIVISAPFLCQIMF